MFLTPSRTNADSSLNKKINDYQFNSDHFINTYKLNLQCAAVSTNFSLIKLPPQKNSISPDLLVPIAHMCGNSPIFVSEPPTIKPVDCMHVSAEIMLIFGIGVRAANGTIFVTLDLYSAHS